MAESRRQTAERRERILILLQDGDTRVDRLSERLGLSPSTIRRDLAALRRDGRVARTYGGALPAGSLGEASLAEKTGIARAQKEAIAKLAATFVAPGASIILDAGSTTGCLANILFYRQGLRVVTNGLTAANALCNAEGVEVVLLGGTLRRISQGTVGPIPEYALRLITVDIAFVGASTLTAARGIGQPDPLQISVKSAMAASARRLVVLADSSKLGDDRYDNWMPLKNPWTLITDWQASEESLQPFLALEYVTVLQAPPPVMD
jgi:DeoR/GlpR family transcriptional regulator of sugar metabolism